MGEEIRRAKVISRGDWRAETHHERHRLDVALEHALAAEWERDAVLEHASIASFARLTLQLLALGAPPELIRESQAASLDEIAHAELCFALASRYRRAPVGPGKLATLDALPVTDLVQLAVQTVREGCIGETLAALLATTQLERAIDPQVRETLARIASDEARHAELSWKIVRWAAATGGSAVIEAVREAFERAAAPAAEAGAQDESIGDAAQRQAWHAHGRLLSHEVRAVIRSGLTEVVEPCARALLAWTRAGSAQ